MHIGSKTTYSDKHYPDQQVKVTRYIDVPWIGTAEIALRWKTEGGPGDWHQAPKVVPCSFYHELEKEWSNNRVIFYPVLEGIEVVPYHAAIWIQEISTYVFSPRTDMYMPETVAEVTIGETYTIKTMFGRVAYDMGISSMRLGEEFSVPPRQSINVYIKTNRIEANTIAQAIKDADCDEARQRGEAFAMGVKILGYYRMSGEPRSWRELDKRESDEK